MKKYCFAYPDKKIKVELIKNPCRYHKAGFKEYNCTKLAPHRLCLDAFYVAYPYCLGLLYDAKFDFEDSGALKIKCPNPGSSLIMEIKSYDIFPGFIISFKRKLIKFFHKIGYYTEYPHKKIKIKIVNNKNCPVNYGIGDEFEFNLWKKDELCPAGFSAVFPYLCKSDKTKVHCPDPRGVIYGVK